MNKLISRRHFLWTGAVSALMASPLGAAAPASSPRPVARDLTRKVPGIERLIDKAGLDGEIGFCVADMASGDLLEEHQSETPLPPASVAKALTACYALDVLGTGFRFETRLVTSGSVVDGALGGDLILAGGGDPTLNTQGLASLVDMLAEAGVKRVDGKFGVWAGALPFQKEIDSMQPDQVAYNPPVCGLNLNFNRVHFEWRREGADYSVTMQARSGAYRPDVQTARMKVVDRNAPIYTYRALGTLDDWTVAKGALGKGGARWLPVRRPELYAAEVFATLARARGISLGPVTVLKSPPDGKVLARVKSAPLPEIVRGMLKYSTNLTAECVGLMATTRRKGAKPASLRISAREMNSWLDQVAGVPGVALVDHSGLGDASRISAQGMMQALRTLRSRHDVKPLLKPFGMRDRQGRVMKDHPIDVIAKTGTLNFVSGLAGFADLPGGREVVFAIFSANLEHRATLSEAERERPPGGRAWIRRAKRFQQGLIERWGTIYAG